MMPDRLAAHFLAVCLFLFLHRFVAGGCSEYGHSCWGGHGKRSSEGTSDWYLSKLLMAQRPVLDQRNIFGSENVVRGPITNTDAIVERLEPSADVLEQYEPSRDIPLAQQNEALNKVRLYELLSG